MEVIAHSGALTPATIAAWRDLADEAGLAYATPEWMLAFWRHMHAPPGDAQLRIVVVRDGERIVGLGPFYGPARRGALGVAGYRLLGAGIGQRTAPLAAAGREHEVAPAFAAALASADPKPSAVMFDAIDAASPFPALMAAAWPSGRRPLVRDDRGPSGGLVATMAEDAGTWLRGRSRNYRRQQVRRRREIETRGGILRRSETPDQLQSDLDAMFRLHGMRFAAQGRHTSLGPLYRVTVGDAAAGLFERDALRLWVIDSPEGVVGAQLFLRAGDRLCAWNGGINPSWERASLGLVLFDEAIRDAHQLGLRLLDFGGGDQAYKHHFADTAAPVEWLSLLVRDVRYPLVRARLAPGHAAHAARALVRRVPERRLDQLRRLVRRPSA